MKKNNRSDGTYTQNDNTVLLMTWKSTQPLTEMSTRSISWG